MILKTDKSYKLIYKLKNMRGYAKKNSLFSLKILYKKETIISRLKKIKNVLILIISIIYFNSLKYISLLVL